MVGAMCRANVAFHPVVSVTRLPIFSDRRLWGNGRNRPASVIGRLLSHSRKQTFAVLLHWQDCAHCGRSWPARRFSKADTISRRVKRHNLASHGSDQPGSIASSWWWVAGRLVRRFLKTADVCMLRMMNRSGESGARHGAR